MDALEPKDTTHFLRDFGDIHHRISIGTGKKSIDFPWSIFLYLMKSRLLLLDSDDPINSLP